MKLSRRKLFGLAAGAAALPVVGKLPAIAKPVKITPQTMFYQRRLWFGGEAKRQTYLYSKEYYKKITDILNEPNEILDDLEWEKV
jgi:hypothetical protein